MTVRAVPAMGGLCGTGVVTLRVSKDVGHMAVVNHVGNDEVV